MKAYTAIHSIERGRASDPAVVNAGEVFAFDGNELEHLLANGAIRESTDDEIALAKGKLKGKSLSKSGAVDVSDALAEKAAAEKLAAADQEIADRLAAAEKAAAEKLAAADQEIADRLAAAEKVAAEKIAEADRVAAEKLAAAPAADAGKPVKGKAAAKKAEEDDGLGV